MLSANNALEDLNPPKSINKKLPTYSLILEPQEKIYDWVSQRLGYHRYLWGDAKCFAYARYHEVVAGAFFDNYTVSSASLHFVQLRSNLFLRDFYTILFYSAFVDLKLSKVFAPVNSSDLPIQDILSRLGFVCELEIPEVFPRDASLKFYALTKDNFKLKGILKQAYFNDRK